MLTPEKRHIEEWLSQAQHVARDRLSLTFLDDPMLDTHRHAEPRLGIARRISCSPDTRRTRAQIGVNDDAVLDVKSSLLGKIGAWTYTDPEHDEIGRQRTAILQLDARRTDGARTCHEVKPHAVFF